MGVWRIDRESVFGNGVQHARHEAIADELEREITAGSLRPGDRLPTVRRIAEELGVSGTTVGAAYRRLASHGLIRTEVGRGSFVADATDVRFDAHESASGAPGGSSVARRRPRPTAPWRKRVLTASSARLLAAYPEASDCSRGRPDPSLLPIDILKRAWHEAIAAAEPSALEYAGPEPIADLADALLPRLERDGIAARKNDLVIGSSAQQLMVLAMEVIDILSREANITVAVEEPGYPTIFDTFERAGYRLAGVEVDAHGAVPESLEAALRSGATTVLFTPRAHNPTGASWPVGRMNDLADVLAGHPDVFVIEDDQFADASAARPGSLISDPRLEDRVVYIRSFSKAIAPDLRIAAAVARPRLRSALLQAKVFADGWSSRLAQRALAGILADETLDREMGKARDAYAERRSAAVEALEAGLAGSGGSASDGHDGVNLWVRLPSGVECFDAVEQAARLGVITAPGEPFFILPGYNDTVRLNIGYVDQRRAAEVGRLLAEAATSVTSVPPPITV